MAPKKKDRSRLKILGLIFSVLAVVIVAILMSKSRSGPIVAFPQALFTNLIANPKADIGPQKPLADSPKVIKAVYATSWSAGSEKKMSYLINLINSTELNAIVIDVKDYSGSVTYDTYETLADEYGTEEWRIPKINALLKRLHDNNIYVIGRVAVFEDSKLPLIRSELALKSKATGNLWKTTKGAYWLDTASKDVWEYNVGIARDMLARGFDEVNFDYIRFASDGVLADIIYPIWNGKTPKREILKNFHAYVRDNLPTGKISADLFGMVTTNKDDLGIGQVIEDALPYYDAVAPMVYPSHYTKNFLGYPNPAQYPYEVVKYSLDEAAKRMLKYDAGREALLAQAGIASQAPRFIPLPRRAALRPWLQDFNLGATYDAEKVRGEIRATTDSARRCSSASLKQPEINGNRCDDTIHDEALGQLFDGWMLWNPSNIYTKAALQ